MHANIMKFPLYSVRSGVSISVLKIPPSHIYCRDTRGHTYLPTYETVPKQDYIVSTGWRLQLSATAICMSKDVLVSGV